MDTAKDARILILEDALKRLNDAVGNRKFRFHVDYGILTESLKTAGSLFYEVKYSYMDGPSLADAPPTENLVAAIGKFGDTFRSALRDTGYRPETPKERLVHADIRYALRTVGGFPRRLRECPEDPAYAVDLLAVEITQTGQVEGAKNLTDCRCTDGTRIWPIVTNIEGLRAGIRLPCAVLPPVEMMGVVSEAMFLSGSPLPDAIPPGPLVDPPSSALDNARAQVLGITKRY